MALKATDIRFERSGKTIIARRRQPLQKQKTVVREHPKKRKEENTMPKIDTSKIEGYESMTAEQKLAALEAFEYNDNAEELEKQKAAVTKANKEAAESKRKLLEKQTDEEKRAQEEAEEKERIQKENAELQEKVAVRESTAQLVALGYPADLAAETAKAMFDGDNAKVFANQKKFLEDQEMKVKAQLLEDTPKPPAGDGKPDVEAFKKMNWTEKAKLKAEDPELFKALDEAAASASEEK